MWKGIVLPTALSCSPSCSQQHLLLIPKVHGLSLGGKVILFVSLSWNKKLYKDITLKRTKKQESQWIYGDHWSPSCSRLMTVCPKEKDFKASSLKPDFCQTMGINHEGEAGFNRRKWTEILPLCLGLLCLILTLWCAHWCNNRGSAKGMNLKKENLHHAA